MRSILVTILFVASIGSAHAETIYATVKGMVCAFCATGIEKTFKKQAAVSDVKVDLESKLLTVHTKSNQTIDDATIEKLVTNAGYSVSDIRREP